MSPIGPQATEGRKPRIFRFEAKWIKHEEEEQIIKEVWARHNLDLPKWEQLQPKLTQCRHALIQWNAKRNRESKKSLEEKLNNLQQLQQHEMYQDFEEIQKLDAEINTILAEEYTKWHQRAKKEWYQLGDRNTKYFHKCATQRYKKN